MQILKRSAWAICACLRVVRAIKARTGVANFSMSGSAKFLSSTTTFDLRKISQIASTTVPVNSQIETSSEPSWLRRYRQIHVTAASIEPKNALSVFVPGKSNFSNQSNGKLCFFNPQFLINNQPNSSALNISGMANEKSKSLNNSLLSVVVSQRRHTIQGPVIQCPITSMILSHYQSLVPLISNIDIPAMSIVAKMLTDYDDNPSILLSGFSSLQMNAIYCPDDITSCLKLEKPGLNGGNTSYIDMNLISTKESQKFQKILRKFLL